jgi:hypothetical protein
LFEPLAGRHSSIAAMLVVRPRTRAALCTLIATSSLAWGNPALAIEKVACVEAAEAGQRLRKQGQLVEARDRLLVCANPDCPDVVSQDCTGWLGEVQRSLSSVSVKAHAARGEPLSDVAVFLDGAELPERAPTAMIDVDPGDHVLRCERAGFKPTELHMRLSEGERGREIECRLLPLDQQAHEDPRARVDADLFKAPPELPTTRAASVPWVVWPLGALGAVGIAGFASFGVWGQAQQNSLRTGTMACAPYCTPEQVSPVRTKFLIADVSLGVGIAALAAAGIVALLHPHSAPAKPTTTSSTLP